MGTRVLVGDVLEQLATLPDGCVQTCVTSPPYWGLRDYGVPGQLGLEPTPDEWVAKMVAVFREVRRVLRDDGTAWVNMGDGYNAQQGAGYPGYGGRNVAADPGIRRPSGLAPKQLIGQPWRLAFALQADGWWLRSDIIWAKPNPMPESVTDRPTKAHEYVFLLSKRARYFYDADAVREAAEYGYSPTTRGNGTISAGGNRESRTVTRGDGGNRNLRTVWTIPTHPFPEAHFATFPPKLVEPCIKAGSRVGDTVLDPFLGSGTTALVADRLGRDAIGIELNPTYAEMARKRIAGDCPMFAEVE
jgi:DNA modification methylase